MRSSTVVGSSLPGRSFVSNCDNDTCRTVVKQFVYHRKPYNSKVLTCQYMILEFQWCIRYCNIITLVCMRKR